MSATQTIDWSKYESKPATPQIDFSKYEDTAPESGTQITSKADSYAAKALSAAGLPTSIADIPNWFHHLAGTAKDSQPFWEPIRKAIKEPTQENIVAATPFFGPVSVAMAQDARKGDYGGMLASGAGALGAVLAGRQVAPGLQARQALAQESGGIAPGMQSALQSSATKNYEEVLAPTKQTTKYATNKIMPQLLKERPTALTREGLAEKAAGQASQAGEAVDTAISNLQGKMKLQPVVDGLNRLKAANTVNGVDLRPEVSNAIDSVSEQMQALGPEIDFGDAVKARRILDGAVQEAKGFQGASLSDASTAKIRKAASDSMRNTINSSDVNLAKANAKYHFWNTLSDVLDQTLQRKTGQRPSLGGQIQTAGAGAAGLLGHGLTGAAVYAGAMKALGDAVHSTGWNTLSANVKLSIADALANGNPGKVGDILTKAGFNVSTAKRATTPIDNTPAPTVNNEE